MSSPCSPRSCSRSWRSRPSADMVLKPHPERKSFIVEGAKKAYLPLLRWSLRRKGVIVAVSIAMLAGTAAVIPRLGTEFMPIMDEGALDTDIQFLPGISLDESLAMSRKVQARLMEFPEVVTIIGKTGQTGIALEARGVEKTGFVGVLQAEGGMDLGPEPRGTRRPHAGGRGGLSRHEHLVQPAHRLPHRRTGRRHAGSAHHQALRRGPGRA